MSNLISRRSALAASLAYLGAGTLPGLAQDRGKAHEGLDRTPDELREIDQIILKVMAEHHVLGTIIAVAKDGKLVLDRGYGIACQRPPVNMTSRTIGDIGSVTKPITAAAVLRLREEGKVDLHAKLMEVLSDLRPFPGLSIADKRFHDIKLHHVLYHSGGFGDQWPKSKAYNEEAERVKAQGERTGRYVGNQVAALDYRLALSTPLKFKPGTEHSYSNFGFVTLRLVVEKASGMRYEEYCERHVLHPMGIHRTRLDSHGPVYFPDETHRYDYHADTKQFKEAMGGVSVGKAGNWIAPMSDMVRFLLAIGGARGKRFFRNDTMELMLEKPPPDFVGDTSRRWPGLGFAVSKSDAGLSYSKNGGADGASTWIEHLADGNIDWALHMNTTHPSTGHEETEAVGPGCMGDAQRHIKKLFRELKKWPEVDLLAG
jgi:CubicO group peptidase (beta-lactamase class C family)